MLSLALLLAHPLRIRSITHSIPVVFPSLIRSPRISELPSKTSLSPLFSPWPLSLLLAHPLRIRFMIHSIPVVNQLLIKWLNLSELEFSLITLWHVTLLGTAWWATDSRCSMVPTVLVSVECLTLSPPKTPWENPHSLVKDLEPMTITSGVTAPETAWWTINLLDQTQEHGLLPTNSLQVTTWLKLSKMAWLLFKRLTSRLSSTNLWEDSD